jgi:hypothetical protein
MSRFWCFRRCRGPSRGHGPQTQSRNTVDRRSREAHSRARRLTGFKPLARRKVSWRSPTIQRPWSSDPVQRHRSKDQVEGPLRSPFSGPVDRPASGPRIVLGDSRVPRGPWHVLGPGAGTLVFGTLVEGRRPAVRALKKHPGFPSNGPGFPQDAVMKRFQNRRHVLRIRGRADAVGRAVPGAQRLRHVLFRGLPRRRPGLLRLLRKRRVDLRVFPIIFG